MFRKYSILHQKSKWLTWDNSVLFDSVLSCDFWPNHSENITNNSNFAYLLTTRWRCAKTMQVASGHGCHNTHQDWFEYLKALQRYSVTSTLSCFSSNSFTRYSRTIWLINLNSITCQHGLKMIWFDFCEGRSRIIRKLKITSGVYAPLVLGP